MNLVYYEDMNRIFEKDKVELERFISKSVFHQCKSVANLRFWRITPCQIIIS